MSLAVFVVTERKTPEWWRNQDRQALLFLLWAAIFSLFKKLREKKNIDVERMETIFSDGESLPCGRDSACAVREIKKRTKGGRLHMDMTQPTEGKASATRGHSELSCDTTRRRGAPALSSLVVSSSSSFSSPSNSLFECSLSFSWKQDKKTNKQSNQLIKTRRALGPELLLDYVREPCIGRVVVVVGQRGAPNLITRRLRPALGESWIFHINRKKTLQFIFTSTFFFEDFTLDKFLFFKGNKLNFNVS